MPLPLGIAYVDASTFGGQVGISKLFDTMDENEWHVSNSLDCLIPL